MTATVDVAFIWSRHKSLLTGTAATLLVACGGGGGGGDSAASAAAAYACDQAAAMAAVVTTPSIAGVALTFNNTPAVSGTIERSVESWPLTIDGESHTLNIALASPPTGTAIRGVVFDLHGISGSQATAPIASLGGTIELINRGYLSVAIARRGNYGSTGVDTIGKTPQGQQLIADYQSRKITYADFEIAAWRYQSNSMVAAMQYASNHPQIARHLHTILLVGASGGSPTAIQTAAESNVFRIATKKAIIRVSGNDSALDTNPEAAPGAYEYYARLAPTAAPSFWAGGLSDPLTSPGVLACQYKFFNQSAGFPNSMVLVPGWGHGSPQTLFSDQLYSYVRTFLAARGFDGF